MNLSAPEIRLLMQSLTTSINLTKAKTQTNTRLTALRAKLKRYQQYQLAEKKTTQRKKP